MSDRRILEHQEFARGGRFKADSIRLDGEGSGSDAGFHLNEPIPSSYSGTDISLFAILPLASTEISSSNLNKDNARETKPFKKFGELQTLSISSTRSVHPVRVLGKSNPLHYTRGARTWAGSMVLASLDRDALLDLYRPFAGESRENVTAFTLDQLPPFTIVVTAANEKGTYGLQVIYGVTLVNYGTTYSVEDLYLETTYSYVATDVTPLMDTSLGNARAKLVHALSSTEAVPNRSFKSITDVPNDGRARSKVMRLLREQSVNQLNDNIATHNRLIL